MRVSRGVHEYHGIDTCTRDFHVLMESGRGRTGRRAAWAPWAWRAAWAPWAWRAAWAPSASRRAAWAPSALRAASGPAARGGRQDEPRQKPASDPWAPPCGPANRTHHGLPGVRRGHHGLGVRRGHHGLGVRRGHHRLGLREEHSEIQHSVRENPKNTYNITTPRSRVWRRDDGGLAC